ncbi:F-box/LRR-repeat protein 6 isoform X1 [Struthio camelus]|uniref:F-box/LRR-repeat protein 6 isoform X1 n=1 Tax=Struthio camelus TaxID=8801 RepID=UPI003603DA18
MAEPGTSAGRGRAEASAAHPPRGARARGRARRRRTPRRTAPDYVVHETDDDMLLIISNAGARPARAAGKKRPPRAPPGKAVPARKKRREEERAPEPAPGSRVAPASSGAGAQSSWGERLPVEILVRIFQPVVARDGAVPFLCRAARVCRLWYGAASNPVLWQKVSLGFCWGEPGKKRPPLMEERVLGTVEWLATSRFSLLRDFVLCHWKSHVPFVLKALQDSCPLLASLKLSHCSGVTTESLTSLAARCTQLDSLNLQNSQVDSSAVVTFLEVAGTRLQQLWLTYSSRMNAIVAALASGCCPGLRLLEVNTEIKQSSQHFQVPVEQLQAACPQLQVLRLLNVIWSPKVSPRAAPAAPGFPQLEELCLATTSYSFVSDGVLQRILHASAQLRVLDLRGCSRVTPQGLQALPCPDLEQLHLGLYGSASQLLRPAQGSALLTWKWRHSLRDLDLAGQSFSERDLEQALAAFAQGATRAALRSLNLTGTKVTLSTVSALILGCPTLTYLNLSSCRYLPRGMKKAYRGQDDVRRCLHRLLTAADEPSAQDEAQ